MSLNEKEMKNNELNPIILVIIIITLFTFIVSFTVFYTQENFSTSCGCNLPIWVIIISISSFGLFAGSLIYYVLTQEIIREKKCISSSFSKILNILEPNEKKVLEYLIKKKDVVYQNKISKDLNLNKVKTSRLINNLEGKKLISKKKEGMTNVIELDGELKKVF